MFLTCPWNAGEVKKRKLQNIEMKQKIKIKKIFLSSFALTNGGSGEGLNMQIKKTKGLGQKSKLAWKIKNSICMKA